MHTGVLVVDLQADGGGHGTRADLSDEVKVRSKIVVKVGGNVIVAGQQPLEAVGRGTAVLARGGRLPDRAEVVDVAHLLGPHELVVVAVPFKAVDLDRLGAV